MWNGKQQRSQAGCTEGSVVYGQGLGYKGTLFQELLISQFLIINVVSNQLSKWLTFVSLLASDLRTK